MGAGHETNSNIQTLRVKAYAYLRGEISPQAGCPPSTSGRLLGCLLGEQPRPLPRRDRSTAKLLVLRLFRRSPCYLVARLRLFSQLMLGYARLLDNDLDCQIGPPFMFIGTIADVWCKCPKRDNALPTSKHSPTHHLGTFSNAHAHMYLSINAH